MRRHRRLATETARQAGASWSEIATVVVCRPCRRGAGVAWTDVDDISVE